MIGAIPTAPLSGKGKGEEILWNLNVHNGAAKSALFWQQPVLPSASATSGSSQEKRMKAAAELILKTAQNVDIFSLSCLPDAGAVETLEHALSNKTEGMA